MVSAKKYRRRVAMAKSKATKSVTDRHLMASPAAISMDLSAVIWHATVPVILTPVVALSVLQIIRVNAIPVKSVMKVVIALTPAMRFHAAMASSRAMSSVKIPT